MNKLCRMITVMTLMVVMMITVAGCGSKDMAKPKTDPKTIVLGVENESDKMNPIFADEHDDAVAIIFSGLTRYNEKNEIEPDLALSWEVSKDQLTYTFKLRNDVKWHDGQPFTAQDVKFTIEQSLNPKNNSKIKERFEEIKEVQVVDPYTVKIVLKTPFPLLVNVMSTGMIPKHILEGKDINNDAFNMAPIGTGAFKFGEMKKGQYLVLNANKEFYRGAPKSEKIILKFIPDQNVRAVQLKQVKLTLRLLIRCRLNGSVNLRH